MAKHLVIEKPWEDAIVVDWTPENLRKYKLDAVDQETMEKGVVVWYNEVAYTMEED